MTKLHTLKSAKGSTKKKKTVGRGGAHGTFSCRGVKGQKSRSGYSRRFGFEGGRTPLVVLLPKFKGCKSLKTKPETITFDIINRKFSDGDLVSVRTLKKNGLIDNIHTSFKIVNTGKLEKKINVQGGYISKKAKEIVEKSGGTVKEIKKTEKKKEKATK